MTDMPASDNNDSESTEKKPDFLVESKMYRLNADEGYIEFLEPDMQTKMQVETILDESYPREDEANEDTRIFVNFTNLKGRGQTYLVADPERLARRFDIDSFFNGYYATMNVGVTEANNIQLIGPTMVSAISTSVTSALDLNSDRQRPAVKQLSTDVLASMISILLNDPKDAMIILAENPLREGETETDFTITAIWTVKSRD